MLKIVCDKCGEAIEGHSVEDHMYLLNDLGITDKQRIRQISNDIRDDYHAEDAASKQERWALFEFAHELVALALYRPAYCLKCHGYVPKDALKAQFHLVKGGKKKDG